MATRIVNNVSRADKIKVTVNGQTVEAYAGETIASILLTQGITAFYQTKTGHPRAPFCNMGTCFECRIQLTKNNTSTWVRACMTYAEQDMSITTNTQLSVLGMPSHAD